MGTSTSSTDVADAAVWEPLQGQFDCIASIATMHHLPMEEMLAKMRRVLKVNGRAVFACVEEEALFEIAVRDRCGKWT